MPDISLFLIFSVGFVSGVHCIAMCGGLSTAFVMQLPKKQSRFKLVFFLNSGRILSYMLIGFLLGGLGQVGINLDKTQYLQSILFAFAQIILILMGLYLMGISVFILKIESVGKPIWQRINPLLNKLLPISNSISSFLVGALWGWLPCGLVYSASTYALGSGSAIYGSLVMLAFGLGTLPNLLLMGFFALQLRKIIEKKIVRVLAGLFIIGIALWQLFQFFHFAEWNFH